MDTPTKMKTPTQIEAAIKMETSTKTKTPIEIETPIKIETPKTPSQMLFARGSLDLFNHSESGELVQDVVLRAIEKFLQTYPLDLPHHPNQQPADQIDAGKASGSITLPLWRKTAGFSPREPHWPAFLEFVMELRVCLNAAEKMFKTFLREEHKSIMWDYEALRKLQENSLSPDLFIASHGYRSCFSSLRLSANLAHEPAALTTRHESPWTVVTFFGQYQGGEVSWSGDGIVSRDDVMARPGDVVVLKSGHRLGNR